MINEYYILRRNDVTSVIKEYSRLEQLSNINNHHCLGVIDYDKVFTRVKSALMNSELWKAMQGVKEDSPYHREESVAIHTQMVLDEFEKLCNKEFYPDVLISDSAKFIIRMSLLFHDVGKPAARDVPENCVRDDEGNVKYYKFSGHEKMSTRIFEDFIMTNFKPLVESGEISPDSIYAIGWLIEHHLPYGVKNKKKLKMLYDTVNSIFNGYPECFKYMVLSDAKGRIGDDQEASVKKSSDWLDEFVKNAIHHQNQTALTDSYTAWWEYSKSTPNINMDKKYLIMMIGCSGIGKSTYANKVVANLKADFPNSTVGYYSFDEIRIKKYTEYLAENGIDVGDMDDVAYYRATYDWFNKLSNETQNDIFQKEFTAMKKECQFIVIDNTSVSKKRRAMFVNGLSDEWVKECVLFLSSIDTINQSQKQRSDKFVNEKICHNMYMAIQYPSYSEFDEISFCVR